MTPIAKSWPSEWCLEANNLAIQVHGGYGYTRDFPVEQLWRDNRLNMIHEGTHGIQALDLLGRKVRMMDGAVVDRLEHLVHATVSRAKDHADLRKLAVDLEGGFAMLREAITGAWQTGNAEEAVVNATPFLQAFGHVVIAWIWLDIALAAIQVRTNAGTSKGSDYLRGKLQAARYFFEYELPKISAWLGVVGARNSTCRNMKEEWFLE